MNLTSKDNSYDLPTKINFNLSWRCNIKCRMCNNEKLQRSGNEELGSQEVVKTIEAYKDKYNISMVRFWGGEPFVRKDLFKIIEKVSPKLKTLAITNGTLITKDNVNDIINCGLDTLEFSIDLPESHHNYLRGEGVYESAMRGLFLLKNEMEKSSSKKPKIVVRH